MAHFDRGDRSPHPATPTFHPAVQQWFQARFGTPTAPQQQGWPSIEARQNTLIAAPTGTGKTLAAFLGALNQLFCRGEELADRTEVLYISPLRALANDVEKNLVGPLSEIRALDPSLPSIRVQVRTGDTPGSRRASMVRRPPHILVTTPESLYILLTSRGGRALLSTVHTVIVDEIHALLRDKRGSHLALSLERLEALASAKRPLLRVGLSATQKPLSQVARFLVGVGRECVLVDAGFGRNADLAVEVPLSPLSAVCTHETWEEIYERITELVRAHRSTIVFVNTRKLAERVAARLSSGARLNPSEVACHHGSLSADRRLAAEQRLKAGQLRVLVATASLELGIDVGDVDLVIQVGAARSIATLIQRVGRAGHGISRLPKGRIFPLTQDELLEAAALVRAVRAGVLDRTPEPPPALDILAQQVVSACVAEPWREDDLFDVLRRAWPYRDLARHDFEAILQMHALGTRPGDRRALLHRDGLAGRVRATRGARITALTSGGAIADNADYQVVLEPEGTRIGTLNEDFAIESNGGDVFQLGTASWRILKVGGGVVRVADAKGAPPTIPFWLGEAPARSRELSAEISEVREKAAPSCDFDPDLFAAAGIGTAAARQVVDYVREGAEVLGAVPTVRRIVLERFFDESGGMQLVVHSPFGGRVNRAFGLALRKRFCRGFGFELQAAANEEAIVLSLGPQHSFPLEEVFHYLHPNTVRSLLIQAILPLPMFKTRWRWNVGRALRLSRFRAGKRVPPGLFRMQADDLLTAAFPAVMACGETLAPGDIEVPMDHPLVRQTVEDCLHEAMDVDGLIELLTALREGRIEKHAVDTPAPSRFAQGILAAQPYAFLDDAPLEERRTQAVLSRRTLDAKTADELGALDEDAIQRVRNEAWPVPANAEDVHESLLWMGYVTSDEASGAGWNGLLDELEGKGRVELSEGRWFACEASRDPKDILRGRLEALGPVAEADPMMVGAGPLLRALEREGAVLRGRFSGTPGWCSRHLLARIHRYTIERLRKEIEPVTTAEFLHFLACWQHVEEEFRLEGPEGVFEVLAQLAGFEAPARSWESSLLPARVRNYRREWLDAIMLRGDLVWARLWGKRPANVRAMGVAFVPRDEVSLWTRLPLPRVPSAVKSRLSTAEAPKPAPLEGPAQVLYAALDAHGAMFSQELARATSLDRYSLEDGLGELVARGMATCDSFGGLRSLLALGSHPVGARPMASHPVGARPMTSHPVVGSHSSSSHSSSSHSLDYQPFPSFRSSSGRWSLLRRETFGLSGATDVDRLDVGEDEALQIVVRQLLRRHGILFRTMMLREKIPVPWRDLLRNLRRLEVRGEALGGRFVGAFEGEQYALPEAVSLLRTVRRRATNDGLQLFVSAADPLNWHGILTPDDRISPLSRRKVRVA